MRRLRVSLGVARDMLYGQLARMEVPSHVAATSIATRERKGECREWGERPTGSVALERTVGKWTRTIRAARFADKKVTDRALQLTKHAVSLELPFMF